VRENEVAFQLAASLQPASDRIDDDIFNGLKSKGGTVARSAFLGPDGKKLYPIYVQEVVFFILDRLRVTLRDEGFSPDILEAAFAIQDDDINRIVARVTALSTFLKTEDGKNLGAGYKRASNILKAEDKKGALPDRFTIDAKELERNEEMALNDALAHVQVQLPDLLEAEDFDGAMTLLSKLRAPVDAFFEADFMVNDPDPAKRLNRLALLAALRDATLQVADFEKIAG
jgi:glycyl-tRNA synthetase beta chain